MGGVIQGQLWPQDDAERQQALDAGHDLDPDFVLATDDLVTGDDCFFVATGITDGDLMRGVRYDAGGCTTHSLVMRSRSGTIRKITPSTGCRSYALLPRSTSTAEALEVRGRLRVDDVDDPRVDRHARGGRPRPRPARATGSMQARQSTMPSRRE